MGGQGNIMLIKLIAMILSAKQRNSYYNNFMIALKTASLLLVVTTVLAQTCTPPSTIFSSSTMSTIFNGVLSTFSYDNSAFDLIGNPSYETFKSYFLSNGKYFIPLWCLGGVTLVLFLLCSLQLCCYHCCAQPGCGTKISKKSYRPWLVSLMVYAYLFFSLVLIALGIVSFMMSSDVLKQADYTICQVNNTFTELFDGKTDGTSPPWSGVDNFNIYASQIATNFPNTIGKLANSFNSPQYQNLVSTSSGSLYSNAASTYSCPTSLGSSTVSCPFPNLTSCLNGSNSQIPTFSSNFCLSTVNDSAASLILKEQGQSSTTWKTKLTSLSSLLTAYNTTNPSFTDIQQYSESLQSSITQYKPTLSTGIQTARDNFRSAEIGMYTVFGFFIFIGVFAFLSVFCTYCGRSFGWRYALFFLWIFFMLLAVLFSVASGFLIVGTFTGYDSCQVYAQLTQNSTAFPSLSYYQGSSVSEVLFTCFFPPDNSTDTIFNSVSQQTNFQQLNELQALYNAAIPSAVFGTVISDIRDLLNYYSNNQNQVTLLGASASQNPQAALDQANVFASNGGSNCNAVNDTFVFNPINCFPRLLNQPANNPSCILLSSSSSTVISNRQNSFTTHNCTSNFASYSNYFNSLNSYGQAVSSLASQYISDPGLSTYQSSYFNYYNAVNDFMSSSTKNLFNSFIAPYAQLVQGSSCSFLTQSLNGLVSYTCNTDFPYLYVLSCIIITLSCIFFCMMVLSYYLTTRLEFYEHLDGDLSKYDPNAPSDDNIQIQMADFTNKQQLLSPQPINENIPQTPQINQGNEYNMKQHQEERYGHYNDRFGHSDPRYRYHRYNRHDEPRGLASPPKNFSQIK